MQGSTSSVCCLIMHIVAWCYPDFYIFFKKEVFGIFSLSSMFRNFTVWLGMAPFFIRYSLWVLCWEFETSVSSIFKKYYKNKYFFSLSRTSIVSMFSSWIDLLIFVIFKNLESLYFCEMFLVRLLVLLLLPPLQALGTASRVGGHFAFYHVFLWPLWVSIFKKK